MEPRCAVVADVRQGRASPSAGASSFAASARTFDWHVHPQHQLIFPLSGVLQVETNDGVFVLPPQQAAWIPAGTPHRTSFREARSASVYFDPTMVEGGAVSILAVSGLMRELAIYAMRWPVDQPNEDPLCKAYFGLLARLCREWVEVVQPVSLPTSPDPALARVIAYTHDNLATATVVGASRAGGLSERTLRRRFQGKLGMSWERFRFTSRVTRAMAMLAGGERSITHVALEVGWESSGAFAKAFRRFTGETPRAYRARHGRDRAKSPLPSKLL